MMTTDNSSAQRINPAAAIQAVIHTAKSWEEPGPDFVDFAKAIKDSPAAWQAAMELVKSGQKADDVMLAIGLGMAAGVAYASIRMTPDVPQGA